MGALGNDLYHRISALRERHECAKAILVIDQFVGRFEKRVEALETGLCEFGAALGKVEGTQARTGKSEPKFQQRDVVRYKGQNDATNPFLVTGPARSDFPWQPPRPRWGLLGIGSSKGDNITVAWETDLELVHREEGE